MAPKKGAWAPQTKVTPLKVLQDGTPKDKTSDTDTPFLNPNPFNWWYGIENVAKVRVNREMHGRLGQWHPDQHHYASFHWKSLPGHWASLRPHGQISHLHRPGEHLHLTYWLCHMGSSRWSAGLCYGKNSPCSPRFVQLHDSGPHDLGDQHKGCVMNVIRENEIDTLVTPWVIAHVAYLLVVRWATATMEDDKVTSRVLDPTNMMK